MLAGGEGAHRPLVMEHIRQRDVDGVDPVIVEEIVVRAVRSLDVVLVCIRLGT
jgi:hypothetical protein